MAIQAPKHLQGPARKWFQAMLKSYEGFESEPAAVTLLTGAAEQLQRVSEYRAAIAKAGGVIVQDRFGSDKEHPAAGGERAAWNSHRLLCRELGIEPAKSDETVRLPRVVGRAS